MSDQSVVGGRRRCFWTTMQTTRSTVLLTPWWCARDAIWLLWILWKKSFKILGICLPFETDVLQNHVSNCLDAVSLWIAANRLQLNHDKMEALWCSSQRRQHQIPSRPIRIGGTSVQPVVQSLPPRIPGGSTWMLMLLYALTWLQLSGVFCHTTTYT